MSDMEVCMEESCVIEFLHVENMVLIDSHHILGGEAQLSHHEKKCIWSGHPCRSADYIQETTEGAEYQLKSTRNDGVNIEIWQFVLGGCREYSQE